jgi:hypothetical protein
MNANTPMPKRAVPVDTPEQAEKLTHLSVKSKVAEIEYPIPACQAKWIVIE